MKNLIIHITGLDVQDINITDLRKMLQNLEEGVKPLLKENSKLSLTAIEKGSVNLVFSSDDNVISHLDQDIKQYAQGRTPVFLTHFFSYLYSFKKTYDAQIVIKTDLPNSVPVEVNKEPKEKPKETKIKTVMYIYGEVVQAGGKNNPNIHVDTEDYGIVIVSLDRTQLRQHNLLYKEVGLEVEAELDTEQNKIEKAVLIELLEYDPENTEKNYIQNLAQKATKHWQGIDKTQWLKSIRE